MNLSRRLWTLYEPIHSIVYFAPEKSAAYKEAGLRGGWMGYFGSRAAPMGPVGAAVVTATFHNFHPAMVARAIPDAWSFSSPQRILEARQASVDTALRRLWGDLTEEAEIREAAELTGRAAANGDPAGRPIFAAHAGLAVPDEPHLGLWHACTLLREHRFDGHVAALTAEGIGGCEALITAVAGGDGRLDAATMRTYRGWSEQEWSRAEDGLQARGLLDAGGRLTAEGRSLRNAVEARTDELALAVWERIAEPERERLVSLLRPLVQRLTGPGGVVYPNPIGLPEPD